MRNHELQLIVAIILLASGVLVSATINQGTNPVGDAAHFGSLPGAPTLLIRYSPGQLAITGVGASDDHEASLRQIAAESFPGVEVQTDFRAGVLLPEHWEQTSARLLHALAATDFAHAIIGEQNIDVRGITSDGTMLNGRLESLRNDLPGSITVNGDIVSIASGMSLDSLCRRNLDYSSSQPVAFRQSSAELRSSSNALLDRVAGLAGECRQHSLAITGHTDASGDEALNRKLSRARAQAVADYLIAKGVAPDRLLVIGAGSSQPIADNATVNGRSRNRRIDFDLR